jgi:hypothetical protein
MNHGYKMSQHTVGPKICTILQLQIYIKLHSTAEQRPYPDNFLQKRVEQGELLVQLAAEVHGVLAPGVNDMITLWDKFKLFANLLILC